MDMIYDRCPTCSSGERMDMHLALRPPVIGYEASWQNTVGVWLNNPFVSGLMSGKS